MDNEHSIFYDDDGTVVNPDLILNPSLCVRCKKEMACMSEDLKVSKLENLAISLHVKMNGYELGTKRDIEI